MLMPIVLVTICHLFVATLECVVVVYQWKELVALYSFGEFDGGPGGRTTTSREVRKPFLIYYLIIVYF